MRPVIPNHPVFINNARNMCVSTSARSPTRQTQSNAIITRYVCLSEFGAIINIINTCCV